MYGNLTRRWNVGVAGNHNVTARMTDNNPNARIVENYPTGEHFCESDNNPENNYNNQPDFIFGESYGYTPEGRIQHITSGYLESGYQYDNDGNITALQTLLGEDLLVDNQYHFDKNGNCIQKETLLGITSYTYDSMNRLTQAIYPQGREVLAYDYADNRISREYFEKTGYNKERLSSRETYQYDECNRLVRCIEEVGEIPEQLDIFGFDTGMGKENPYPSENNIAGMVIPESKPFTSDGINDGVSTMSEHVPDISTSINGHVSDSKQTVLPQGYKRNVVDYVYDNQGNLLKDGNAEYSYDLFNRLEKAETFNGDVQKNRYDAEGLRHEMEENGRLVQFLYSEKEVVAEKEDDGNVIRYIRGYQLISSDNEKAKVYYQYASDELGSVTHIVNGNVKRSPYKLEYGMRIAGSESNCDKSKKKNNCFSTASRKKVADNDFRVMNRYEYDAFGNTVKCEEKVHNRFRFAGEQYDPLTQQYYLRARCYNLVIGRFIQEDNYYGDGLNLYAYCKNNPVRYVDPSGHGTTSAADKEIKAKNANDLKDYVDELNEQGGVTPEDAEALKELAEEFDLDPNELDIQIKQKDTPVKPNDAGNADSQSIPSDENMITRYANQYGLESDSLGTNGRKTVNGYDAKVNVGQQNKHIPETNEYKTALSNGQTKSIMYGDVNDIQKLLDTNAGTGEFLGTNKERVDFGQVIGYVDPNTGVGVETTVGIIHYGKKGAHIVPARPN